jgi:multidrug efflux system membrane fusion protein
MRRRYWLLTLGIAAAGAGLWVSQDYPLPFASAPAAPAEPAPAVRRPGAGTAPVVRVAVARSGDLAMTLDGLGTVQAYNSVIVASRVDGQLLRLNFREGQDVKEGELLAQIDPRTYQAQLDQAIAKRAQDQAQLENAKRDLERYGALIQQNYASRQQYDTARSQVAQIEAALKADDAAISAARILLSYTNISAPISGRLGFRQVDAGNIVRANDAAGIVTITQLQPISVIFTLPQQRLPDIVAKMRLNEPLDVRALRADGTALDTGTVEYVDNQIDPTTGTIKLKAVFPNAALELWPGGFVNVRLRIGTVRDAVLVPSAAIQYGPDGPFAFVVNADSVADVRPVKALQSEGDTTAVGEGLKPGDRVVLGGQDRLRNGGPVSIAGDAEPGAGRPAGGRPAGAQGGGPAGAGPGGGRRPPS